MPLLDTPDDATTTCSTSACPATAKTVARLQRERHPGRRHDRGRQRRLLLQIFSEAVIGPVFFEFIQRKGDEGFGEGNFQALFESMEQDQIRRGVLS